MRRRPFLSLTASGLVAGLAGCSSSEDDSGDEAEGAADGGSDGNDEGGSADGGDSDSGDETTETEAETETTEESGSLEIQEHEFYEEDFSAGVRGILQNNTGETKDYVEVTVEFYDEDDVKLEDGLDNTEGLDPEGQWQFDAPYLGDDPSDVDRYEIEASDSPM